MARRRRNPTRRLLAIVVVVAAGGAGYWHLFGDQGRPGNAGNDASQVPLTSDRPEAGALDGGPQAQAPERGSSPDDASNRLKPDVNRGRALLASGRQALEQGRLVTARSQLGEALQYDLPLEQRVRLQADLTRLARQTIFSNAVLQDDPFVEAHVIQPGETLGKIAKQYQVTDDFLARINGLTDKNHIRAGQRIKAVHGPFHAVVTKADYTLDVYLGDTFLLRYPVGLGADGSTPDGKWIVQNKLRNPQYYPPRGGKIILADDPENPLGERWIGLKGVEGQALGQERYGIHGTIEPDSIGISASLGCIRMHNADAEEFFDLVVVNQSRVTVK